MKALSLFSGFGMMDLAAEVAGFTIAGQCEIDDYCTAVLERHWPGVRRWRDVRDLSGDAVRVAVGDITLLFGGPPCQPVSLAGKRRGQADDRWLWGEALRLVAELQPCWCCFENPPGLDGMGLDDVLATLESHGYEAGPPLVIPAAGVGAPHPRGRIWILAHSRSIGSQGSGPSEPQPAQGASAPALGRRPANGGAENVGILGNPPRQRMEGHRAAGLGIPDIQAGKGLPGRAGAGGGGADDADCCTRATPPGLDRVPDGPASWLLGDWPAPRGAAQKPWEPARTAKGVRWRKQRLMGLGNGVVPQQAIPIFTAIADYERGLL